MEQGIIDNVVSKQALKQVDDLTVKLNAALVVLEKLISAQSQGNANTKQQKELSDALAKINRLEEQQAEAKKKVVKVTEDQKQAMAAANRELKLTTQLNNSAIGSYNRMSAQYSLNRIEINKWTDAEIKNSKAKQQMIKDTNKLREQMSQSQRSTGNATLDVGKYENAINKAGLAVKTLVVAGIAMAAQFLKNAFTSSTQFAVDAEKSMQRLSFAIKQVGGGSDSDVALLTKQAEDLMGIFDDEQIKDAATKMLNFGLTVAQVHELMPGMIDAAAQGGFSLEEMATAIDKGVNSGVMARSSLGQLGLAFKDTGSQAENYAIIVEGLTKLEGGNEAAMKSQWGTLQNLKIRWDEVKEAVGNVILKALVPLAEKLGKTITDIPALSESLKGLGKMVLVLLAYFVAWNAKMIVNNILLKEGIGLKIKDIAIKWKDIAVTNAQTVTQTLYAATVGKTTLATKAAAGAQALWNLAMKMNPWGLAIAGLTTLILLISAFSASAKKSTDVSLKMTETQKSQKSVMDSTTTAYDTQKGKVDALTKVLHNEKLGLEARKTALVELKKIVPDYHGSLTKEGELINDNTTAIKDYLVQLERQIRMDASKKAYTELFTKRIAQEQELARVIKANKDNPLQGSESQVALQDRIRKQGISILKAGIKETDTALSELGKTMSEIPVVPIKELSAKELKAIAKENADALKEEGLSIQNVIDRSADYVKILGAVRPANEDAAKSFAELQKTLAELEKDKALLTATTAEEKIKIEQDYARQIRTIDLELAKNRLEIQTEGDADLKKKYEQAGKDIVGIVKAQSDAEKLADEKRVQTKKDIKDKQTDIEKLGFDIAKSLGDSYFEVYNNKLQDESEAFKAMTDGKLKDLEEQYNAGLISNEDYQTEKGIIEADALAKQNEIDKKERQAKKEAFLLQQAIAVAEIWIDYAKATGASGFNPLLQPWYLGEAIAMTALIAAQSIPYFEHGGTTDRDGNIIVNEKRRELVVEPSGRAYIPQTDGATMLNVPKGTQIYPDASILNNEAINSAIMLNVGGTSLDTSKLEKKLDKLIELGLNKPAKEKPLSLMEQIKIAERLKLN